MVGARGQNHKRLQAESGCRIEIRGKDVVSNNHTPEEATMPQHVHIEGDTEEQIEAMCQEAERYRAEDEEYGRKVALRNACEEALFKVKGGGDELDEIRDWLDADADEATLDEIMAKAKLLNDNHKAGIEFTADGTVKVSSAEGWSD